MERGRIITGARARFSIEGVKVGYATGVTLGEELQNEEAIVLDNIEVEENVTVGYRVNFSCRMIKIIGETLKSRGWFPKTGANSEEHLLNILAAAEMTATIEDPKTGKIYATVEQVKPLNHNYTIEPRAIVGEDVQFSAIRIKDESEI